MLIRPNPPTRRAAAVVELAVVLPLLVFLFLATVDYGRVFYFSQVVTCCARNGALYASDPVAAVDSPYHSLEEAASADAPADMRAQLRVTSTAGSDSAGAYVQVTVTYPFLTCTSYPGIPQTTLIQRTAVVRPASATPK